MTGQIFPLKSYTFSVRSLRIVISLVTVAALTFNLAVFNVSGASAIQGGADATGDSRVVALVFGSNTRASCSGVPLSPYVVVAAAHCLSNPNFTYMSELYRPTGLSVAQAGVDLTRDNISLRPHVLQVAVTPGFNDKSFSDDVAFYFLDAPLTEAIDLPIANLDELKYVKDQGLLVTHLGYGYILGGNVEDYKAHKIVLKAAQISSMRFGYLTPSEESTISSDESQGMALCKHDSGGPFLATIGGAEKLFAVNLSADGCDRYGVGVAVKGTYGLSVFPYLSLLERQWKIFIEAHKDLPGISSANNNLLAKISSASSARPPKAQPSATPSIPANPTPAPSVSPTPEVTKTPQTIRVIKCLKGKVIKTISGASPQCPKGYKLIK
jgi:hypothetical protein